MLFLFTILVVLSAVVFFAVSVRRRKSNLLQENPRTNISAETFRPLFAPDDAEIRAFECAEALAREAEQQAESRRIAAEKIAAVAGFQTIWQTLPDKRNTIELIRLAAQSANGTIYLEAAEKVLAIWRTDKIEKFSAGELAQLLESHFWLLPIEEKTSGDKFWLNQTVADLRRKF